jgi:hypothetical protein
MYTRGAKRKLPTHLLAASLDEILQQDEGLVDVAPVLAVVVQALPDHLHDLREGDHVVGEVGDLAHHGGRGSPWVVGRGLPDLDLCICVVVRHILDVPPQPGDVHSHVLRFRWEVALPSGKRGGEDDEHIGLFVLSKAEEEEALQQLQQQQQRR